VTKKMVRKCPRIIIFHNYFKEILNSFLYTYIYEPAHFTANADTPTIYNRFLTYRTLSPLYPYGPTHALDSSSKAKYHLLSWWEASRKVLHFHYTDQRQQKN
jgi:hypothetical protein